MNDNLPLFRASALAVVVILAGAASMRAQMGDAPGEKQAPLVPAAAIPPAPVLSPAEALKSMIVAPGYRLEVAASEPLVQDPVAISFGPDGRMWVVEMRGYMPNLDGRGEDAPVGRVVVLSDRDGDGVYDEAKVFLDHLVLPRTVLPVKGGALIGAPPELAFWTDTDGDGRADRRQVLATDYGNRIDPSRPNFANPELAPNSLLWAQDNWIYSAAYTRKFRYAKGEWESAPTRFRGQWGLTQDDLGRFYYNSNSDQLRVDIISPDSLSRNPNFPFLDGANVQTAQDQLVWPARVTPGVNRGYRPEVLRSGRLKAFTAACGPWMYRGDLLPELAGSVFVAEPAGNLVRRDVLTARRGRLEARNPYDQGEFIASTDERFRPVSFATGPDGALYVVDFYRGLIQHRLSLTTYLRKQSADRHLDEPLHYGRIYRVVPADAHPARQTRIAPLADLDWVGRLADPNAWWRDTAQQVLVENGNAAVLPAIRRMAGGPQALGRRAALAALDGMGALEPGEILAALGDTDPAVRVAACRFCERLLDGPQRPGLIARLLASAKDPAPEVQLQAVLTLGLAADPAIDLQLAQAVRENSENDFVFDAFCSGLAGRELALLRRLLAAADWPAGDARANTVVEGLALGVMNSRIGPQVTELFALASSAMTACRAQALAILEGVTKAAAISRRRWQLERQPPGWAELETAPETRSRLELLKSEVLWPGKPGAEAVAVAPLSPAQQQRFEAGRQVFMICSACHQPTGRGLDGLAPPLLDSEWVLGKPGRIIRVVLHGLTGPIKVQKRPHSGEMPAFGTAFTDEQIASVLTYIRREWGHTATAIDPAEVTAVRAATAGHSGAWSAEELRGAP